MLFRPVYGPELEAIFVFINKAGEPVSREDIYQAFLSSQQGGRVSTQGVDDALSFLAAAHLVKGNKRFRATPPNTHEPFRLLVLRQLQALAQGHLESYHETDPLYLQLLDQLYIKPDHIFISDLHTAANQMRAVKRIGGLSQEKVRAWKRVMSFLGLGHRIGNGFQCALSPNLLLVIIDEWLTDESVIHTFVETSLSQYLPSQTHLGDLAQAVQQAFLYLTNHGQLGMHTRPDSSSRPYFGQRQWRYMTHNRGEI